MLLSLVMASMGAIFRLKAPAMLDVNLFGAAWLVMGVTLGCVVAPAVLRVITYHHIVGAILLYLTIAVTFVGVFTFVGSFVPKAFLGCARR